MKTFLEILGDLVLIGCGIAFIYIFFSIWLSGGYMAVERSKTMLYFEMGLGITILLLGIGRFIDDVRNGK